MKKVTHYITTEAHVTARRVTTTTTCGVGLSHSATCKSIKATRTTGLITATTLGVDASGADWRNTTTIKVGKMLIGITGLKGSGKDTVAAYLVKKHGFERRAFADNIKKSVAALLEIPYDRIERWKNDPQAKIELRIDSVGIYGMTFRTFLQRYGTEAHRNQFGDDFWVDLTLPVGGFYAGRAIVVSDCRFINEFERIKSLNGFIVRVDRGSFKIDPHRSETEMFDWEPDYILMNDSNYDDLFDSVESMLLRLRHDS